MFAFIKWVPAIVSGAREVYRFIKEISDDQKKKK